jgi:hypothetical protein
VCGNEIAAELTKRLDNRAHPRRAQTNALLNLLRDNVSREVSSLISPQITDRRLAPRVLILLLEEIDPSSFTRDSRQKRFWGAFRDMNGRKQRVSGN